MKTTRRFMATVFTVALVLIPQLALAAGSCSSFTNSDTTSTQGLPYFVNLLINNLPYILAVIAIVLIAVAALDQGGLPTIMKNGLIVVAIVLFIGALLSFLLNWHPVCFS